MSFCFLKAFRLRKNFEFKRVLKARKRLVGQFICIDYRKNEYSSHPKLGLSVNKKYGNSILRNRFKRIVREAFRQNISKITNLEMNISPRSIATNAKLKDIEKDLLSLLQNIK